MYLPAPGNQQDQIMLLGICCGKWEHGRLTYKDFFTETYWGIIFEYEFTVLSFVCSSVKSLSLSWTYFHVSVMRKCVFHVLFVVDHHELQGGYVSLK